MPVTWHKPTWTCIHWAVREQEENPLNHHKHWERVTDSSTCNTELDQDSSRKTLMDRALASLKPSQFLSVLCLHALRISSLQSHIIEVVNNMQKPPPRQWAVIIMKARLFVIKQTSSRHAAHCNRQRTEELRLWCDLWSCIDDAPSVSTMHVHPRSGLMRSFCCIHY